LASDCQSIFFDSYNGYGQILSITFNQWEVDRQRFILIFIALGFIVSALAFAGAGQNLPAADAGILWTYMPETNSYQGWGYWPGYAGIYPGKSHHGKYLKLFVNSIALKAAREGTPMPDGAILVKENYGEDQITLMAVTPIYKLEGHNPEGGGWF
jgi:hypothetical protein